MLGFAVNPGADAVYFVAIFDHPKDAPQHVVARWNASIAGGVVAARIAGYYETIDQARADVPAGAVRFMPMIGDPPNLVESWML